MWPFIVGSSSKFEKFMCKSGGLPANNGRKPVGPARKGCDIIAAVENNRYYFIPAAASDTRKQAAYGTLYRRHVRRISNIINPYGRTSGASGRGTKR